MLLISHVNADLGLTEQCVSFGGMVVRRQAGSLVSSLHGGCCNGIIYLSGGLIDTNWNSLFSGGLICPYVHLDSIQFYCTRGTSTVEIKYRTSIATTVALQKFETPYCPP